MEYYILLNYASYSSALIVSPQRSHPGTRKTWNMVSGITPGQPNNSSQPKRRKCERILLLNKKNSHIKNRRSVFCFARNNPRLCIYKIANYGALLTSSAREMGNLCCVHQVLHGRGWIHELGINILSHLNNPL